MAAESLAANGANSIRFRHALVVLAVDHGQLVAADHLLDHAGGGDAGQVGAPGGGGEGESEADQVVSGIADHRLVKVTDLDFHLAFGVGKRAEIAEMTVAADPDRRPDRKQLGAGGFLEPMVEVHRGPAHVGVSRARHLERPRLV